MKLYILNINDFSDFKELENLSPDRQEKVNSFKNESDKKRSYVAGLMLKKVLGDSYKNIKTAPEGKPYLENGRFFNLSHSGDYAVLAVSDCEVGADIEKISSYNQKIAERRFTKEEYEWLLKENNSTAFFKLWTAKEAVMKLYGKGLKMSPESFSVLPISAEPHIINQKEIFFNQIEHNGYIICTAATKKEAMEINTLSRQVSF